MDILELFDVVVLTEAISSHNLRKGELGTIVEILDEEVFLVEFADTKGVTYAIVPLKSSSLMKVYYEPLLAQ
jgi:Domain of unknown function (DUF4926)